MACSLIFWSFLLIPFTLCVPWCQDSATISNFENRWCIKFYWTPTNRRLPRALQPPSFENANVLVSNSEASNVTIRQLIDINSQQSRVEIREQRLQVQIDSLQSGVNIDPRESHANISVKQPQIFVNASSTTTMRLSAASSEIL